MSTKGRKYGTPFAETEILLAMAERDVDHVRALLAEMKPGERRALEHQCEEISGIIQVMREDEE
ncbi:hypothetical protein ACQPYK_25180 [Streptosporangium sp. CA-135522]|uniref:hypothetical protein n=1 Tax=Streptosporangium sp. CA-135522 TaxID=3240072 RepID=UPI003D8F8BD7